ncbi:hypothetical protein [Halomonas organivorans]|uniref:Uncharacterized protein n=1 Tax=Halomonas organivorans TaxID=257772 RepID=A0A7W5C117_9GAMM|nr:hypothetical protein [Halomonas organivorans]MBB3142842.1 hypothetical protein [Halomonas organivorans]
MATGRESLLWRKRLERRGWVSLRRGAAPGNRVVEYHVVWQGWLISGRVLLGHRDRRWEWWEPGSPTYLLERRHDVTEGVWRYCRRRAAQLGQVARRVPW